MKATEVKAERRLARSALVGLRAALANVDWWTHEQSDAQVFDAQRPFAIAGC
jgi:uncharacterized protein YqcC (DUF446 family)